MRGAEHREIRKSLHLSQERWGKLVGANRVAVSDWERNKYPIPQCVELIALLLASEPETLFKLERLRGMRK